MPNKVFSTEKSHNTEFLKLLASMGMSFEEALNLQERMDTAGFIVVKAAPPGTRTTASNGEDD